MAFCQSAVFTVLYQIQTQLEENIKIRGVSHFGIKLEAQREVVMNKKIINRFGFVVLFILATLAFAGLKRLLH